MKIFIILTIFLTSSNNLVQEQRPSKKALPESKKIDILLPKNIEDPIVFRTRNVVKSIYSFNSPVKIYSRNGEVLKAKPKRSAKSRTAEQIPIIRKIKTNPPNHSYFKNYQIRPNYYNPNERKLKDGVPDIQSQNEVDQLYDDSENPENYQTKAQEELSREFEDNYSQNSKSISNLISHQDIIDDINVVVKDPIEVIDLQAQDLSDLTINANVVNKSLEKIFESTDEYEKEHKLAMKIHMEHLNVAYSHIVNIENQIRDAIIESKEKDSKLMNNKVRHLLENFIDNVDFLEKSLSSSQSQEPPKLYDYFLDKEITLDELEALNTDEQNLESEQKDFNEIEEPISEDDEYHLTPDIKGRFNLSANKQNRKRRYLRRVPIHGSYRKHSIRRAYNTNDQSIITEYPEIKPPDDSVIQPLKFIPPQNINSSHTNNFIMIIESLKSFYDSLFQILPDPANIFSQDSSKMLEVLNHYRKIEQFSRLYSIHIKTFEADLIILRSHMKAIENGLHNALNFYGYQLDFEQINSKLVSNSTDIGTNLNAAVDIQTKLFSERIGNILIYIDEIEDDIHMMKELIKDIVLPQTNESLLNKEFIDTINYSNNKLPKIIGMKEPIYRHIFDLQSEFEILKEQQKEMDKIFTKVKEDLAKISSGSSIVNFVWLSLLIIGYLF